MSEMSYSAYKQYLANNEYVLWQGAPQKGNLLTPDNIYLIPFSIFLVWLRSILGNLSNISRDMALCLKNYSF